MDDMEEQMCFNRTGDIVLRVTIAKSGQLKMESNSSEWSIDCVCFP